MSVIWKIIYKIDDLIDSIPSGLTSQLKNLFSFILFVLVILAIFIGYKMGKRAGVVPGEPLIKYTNEILRQRKNKKAALSSLRLAEEDSLLINLPKDEFSKKSQIQTHYNKSSKLNPKNEDRYINIEGIRGLEFERKLKDSRIKEMEKIDSQPFGIDPLDKERIKIPMNNINNIPFPRGKEKKFYSTPMKLQNKKNNPISKNIIRKGLKSEKPLYNY